MHGIFYAMQNYMPQKTLISIYYSLVYPIVIQNIVIWGGICQINLIAINTKLNKILRCILGVKAGYDEAPSISTNLLYKTLGFLKFDDIYRLHLVKFFHFILYEKYYLFLLYFSDLLPNHNYFTRHQKINLPPIRLSIERQGTVFQLCKLINELDEDFLVPQSQSSLKRKFIDCCLEKY